MPLIVKQFDVVPVPKPRMTQRDSWKKRPIVLRYYAFKDEVNLQKGDFEFPEYGAEVWFFLPMPKSWSEKKKQEFNNQPHQQKPDIDNLGKALFDALLEEDCRIWSCKYVKIWHKKPGIVIRYHGKT